MGEGFDSFAMKDASPASRSVAIALRSSPARLGLLLAHTPPARAAPAPPAWHKIYCPTLNTLTTQKNHCSHSISLHCCCSSDAHTLPTHCLASHIIDFARRAPLHLRNNPKNKPKSTHKPPLKHSIAHTSHLLSTRHSEPRARDARATTAQQPRTHSAPDRWQTARVARGEIGWHHKRRSSQA